MIPAVVIGSVVYICSLCCCPPFAKRMLRKRNSDEGEERVDRDFFKDFQSDSTWQHMLLYIFKHNRIIFHKEDFKEHYEEQKAAEDRNANDEESKFAKSSKIEDNLSQQIKIDHYEDVKEGKFSAIKLIFYS